MRLPALLVTPLAALSLLVGGAVTTAAPAAAAACSDVEVVFARGTGEAPGLGVAGRPLVEGITRALPDLTVSSYAVDYAAATSQTSAGPGATDMSRHVRETAAACPGTRFVLGGYSQGATVTDIALGIRTGTTTGTPVAAQDEPRVAAVVVFGNPLGIGGGRTIATASSTYGDRSRDYCNSSDSVCGSQPKTGTGGHLSYVSNGSVAAGATFAADLVRRTAPTDPTTPPTTPAPAPTCVSASTRAHVDAGRATDVLGYAYAKGSRDYLGRTSAFGSATLRQVDASTWERALRC